MSVSLYRQFFVGGFISYLCYFCMCVDSGVEHVFSIWVIRRVSYQKQKLFTLSEHMRSPGRHCLTFVKIWVHPLVFWWVFPSFSFLRSVSVHNVACIRGPSIIICHFLWRLLYKLSLCTRMDIELTLRYTALVPDIRQSLCMHWLSSTNPVRAHPWWTTSLRVQP